MGLEFCPSSEGSTVLEAQIRKGAAHSRPHSRRRGPDSGWGCSTILGATGTDEHAGGFARRAAKGARLLPPAPASPQLDALVLFTPDVEYGTPEPQLPTASKHAV